MFLADAKCVLSVPYWGVGAWLFYSLPSDDSGVKVTAVLEPHRLPHTERKTTESSAANQQEEGRSRRTVKLKVFLTPRLDSISVLGFIG